MTAVADLRRGQVLAAAAGLVAEGGLEAMTFGALEKRLPFTRGVITWHFADKAALLACVLEAAVATIDAEMVVDPLDAFADQIREVLESKIHSFLRHTEATRVVVAFLSGGGEVAPMFQRWRRQAAGLARAAKADGEAPRALDEEAFGALLVGLVIGVVVQVQYAGLVAVGPAVELAVQSAISAAIQDTRPS